MKTNLFAQASLSLVLALSLSACQKNEDSASPEVPAQLTKTSVETPVTQKITHKEALDALATIGLQFTESPSLAESELHDVKVSWDLAFYRHYLKSEGPKLDLAMQIEVLKNFVSTSQDNLKDLAPSEDLENESAEDLQRAHDKAVIEAQIILAQARIGNLEKKLARQQKKSSEDKTNDSPENGSDSPKSNEAPQ